MSEAVGDHSAQPESFHATALMPDPQSTCTRAILRTPGIAKCCGSVVGRLPEGAARADASLPAHARDDRFVRGRRRGRGRAAVGYGLGSPVLGRLIDRRGQTAVIPIAGLVCGASPRLASPRCPTARRSAAMIAAAVAGGASSRRFPPASARSGTRSCPATSPLDVRLRVGRCSSSSTSPARCCCLGVIGAWSLQAAVARLRVAQPSARSTFAANRLSRAWRPHGERPATLGRRCARRRADPLLGARACSASPSPRSRSPSPPSARPRASPAPSAGCSRLWGVGSMVGGLVAGRLKPPGTRPAPGWG